MIRLLAAAALALLLALPAAAVQNVVLVLLDDWGYDKYNSALTPNLVTLAGQGMYFSRFTSEANCSPARVALLTGRHPFRTGVGTVVSTTINGLTDWGLDASDYNFVRYLNGAGVRTVAIGKWHMGGPANESDLPTHPNKVGFLTFKGTLTNLNQGGSTNYTNYQWVENGVTTTGTQYITTREVDEGITAVGGTTPFFLYLALHAPHDPISCPANTLTPTYDAICTPQVGNGDTDQTKANYHAMVEAADGELQRLWTAIANGPGWANTCAMVIGDNGTDSSVIVSPFNVGHGKGTMYRQGSNTPLIVRGSCVSDTGTTGTQTIQVTDISATILDIVGLGPGANGTYHTQDGISFKSYLADHTATTIRTTAFTQAFVPNGLPYTPTQVDTVGVNWPYRRLHFQSGGPFLFQSITDEHEATNLDDGSFTPTEQTAWDLLDNITHMPTQEPRRIVNGRTLH